MTSQPNQSRETRMTDLKIAPVQKVGAVGRCMASPQSYESHVPGYQYRKPTKQRVAEYALAKLEEARKLDVEAHAANLQAIEANKAIRERITALMEQVGLPATRKVQAGTRYGRPKFKSVDAGYLEDMREHAPISDGFDHATSTYDALRTRYEQYATEGVREAEQAARDAEQAEERRKAERRANLELAEIILRYDLDRDAEWADVLGALRERDQRLDLAVAMQQTRGDWSEGYYRVSDALSRFTVKTPEDAEIQTDILSCFNEDIDGRVFRDTEWNYTRLFSTASDQQLAADIQKAAANAERD